MIKLVLIGAWACLATLASSYATAYFRSYTKTGAEQAVAQVESKKTKEIDVPKIRDGALKGYVVTQFVYSINVGAQKKHPISPEALVVDEAFRYLFNDDSIDFDNLKKYDLQKFTNTVIKNVNARLKADVVADLAIQEFTFMTSTDAKQHM
ncbi:MAG TPA: hypothetical protein VGY52_08295 [Roseiarcus sp.]|jgi:hypothetical protein|nr:hypothetical protein [Roseiarcus sp.]